MSDRLIRLPQNLVKEQGILPTLGKKKGVGVCEENRNCRESYTVFESDENNRMCPGKKECTKVFINESRVVKQSLVLRNLNELYLAFKKLIWDVK